MNIPIEFVDILADMLISIFNAYATQFDDDKSTQMSAFVVERIGVFFEKNPDLVVKLTDPQYLARIQILSDTTFVDDNMGFLNKIAEPAFLDLIIKLKASKQGEMSTVDMMSALMRMKEYFTS